MKDADAESSAKDPAEIRAINNENRDRDIENNGRRTAYGGEQIDPQKLEPPKKKNQN